VHACSLSDEVLLITATGTMYTVQLSEIDKLGGVDSIAFPLHLNVVVPHNNTVGVSDVYITLQVSVASYHSTL